MHQYIESIRVVDRQFQHIDYHTKRLNLTRKQCLGSSDFLDLSTRVPIPDDLDLGVFKCRVVYGEELNTVEFIPYVPKKIETLRLVQCDEATYPFKSEDRDLLNALFDKRGEADDILIVKNNCLTDTSYSNIALYDGVAWYTPDTFLLNGTCRQRLINEGVLHEMRITVDDLSRFLYCRPINAMLVFENTLFAKIVR